MEFQGFRKVLRNQPLSIDVRSHKAHHASNKWPPALPPGHPQSCPISSFSFSSAFAKVGGKRVVLRVIIIIII